MPRILAPNSPDDLSRAAQVFDVAPSAMPVGRVAAWAGSSTFNGAGSTDGTRYAVRAVTPQIAGLARTARYQESIGAGVDGDNSSDLLARFDGILAQRPDIVFVNIGGNDASQDVPRATFAANIAEIVRRTKRAGKPIVLTTITPRASAAPGTDRIAIYNLWLTTFAQVNRIPLADFYGATVDPATGYCSATYAAGDGVHLNNAGHAAIATTLSNVLRDLIALPAWMPAYGIVPTGLVLNPLCSGGTGTALPTNWFLGAGTSTGHTSFGAAPTQGDGLIAGQWAGVTVDNTAGGASVYRELRTGNFGTGTVSEGDRLRVYCQVKTAGYFAETGLRLMNNATAFASPISALVTAAPGPIVFDATAPATPTQLRVLLTMTIPAGQTGSCYLGACNVYNLTTGGLVGIV